MFNEKNNRKYLLVITNGISKKTIKKPRNILSVISSITWHVIICWWIYSGNISLPILVGDFVSKSKNIITNIIPIPPSSSSTFSLTAYKNSIPPPPQN